MARPASVAAPPAATAARLALVLVLTAACATADAASDIIAGGVTTTLTGWCDNSIRVQMTPADVPSAVASQQARISARLESEGLSELPGAFVTTTCTPTPGTTGGSKRVGGLAVTASPSGTVVATRVVDNKVLFTAVPEFTPSAVYPGFLTVSLVVTAGDKTERVYGLGQGNWTANGGCASGSPQVVVPLERNGQTVELLQRKFHVVRLLDRVYWCGQRHLRCDWRRPVATLCPPLSSRPPILHPCCSPPCQPICQRASPSGLHPCFANTPSHHRTSTALPLYLLQPARPPA